MKFFAGAHWLFLPVVGPLLYPLFPKTRFNVGCFLASMGLFAYALLSQGFYYLWYVVPFFAEDAAKIAYVIHNVWVVALYLLLFNATLTRGEFVGDWGPLKVFFARNFVTNALVVEGSKDSDATGKNAFGQDFSQYLSQ